MNTEETTEHSYVGLVSFVGWFCLLVSGGTMYMIEASVASDNSLDSALNYLFIGRLFGIAAFCSGVYTILHERWTSGTLLIVISLVFPVISLLLVGSI